MNPTELQKGSETRRGRSYDRKVNRRFISDPLTAAGGIAAAFIAVAAGVGIALMGSRANLGIAMIAAIAGGISVVVFGVLAYRRFDVFILVLLALRPALDGFNAGSNETTSNAGPSTALGLLFLGASAVWLAHRRRIGKLRPPSMLVWGFGGLVAAALLSCLVAVQPLVSLVATSRLAAGWLMFVVLEQLIATRPDFDRHLVLAINASAVMVVVWTLVQMATHHGFHDEDLDLDRALGPFVHPNVLAKFLMIAAIHFGGMIILHRVRPRIWVLGTWLGVMVGLALTYARFAWIAVALGLIYLLAQRSWRLVPPLLAILAIALITIPSLWARVAELWVAKPAAVGVPENSLVWRLGYWQQLIGISRLSPINGMGLNSVPFLGGEGLAAHNVWVQSYVEMGYVGIAAMLATVVTAVMTLRRTRPFAPPAGHRVATAVGLGLLLTTVSENLLNETTTLWFAAAIMCLGYVRPAPSDAPGASPSTFRSAAAPSRPSGR